MTEQERLADLIEEGYKKHGLKFGQRYYLNPFTKEACPIFAAYTTTIPEIKDYVELEKSFYYNCNGHGEAVVHKALGISTALLHKVSVRHSIAHGNSNSLESTLELLRSNSL